MMPIRKPTQTHPDKGLYPMPPATHPYNLPCDAPEGSKREEECDASKVGEE